MHAHLMLNLAENFLKNNVFKAARKIDLLKYFQNYPRSNCFTIKNINVVALNNNRYFSQKAPQPQLMEFEQIVWPSFFKSFNNYILYKFIIKRYMDRDFDLHEFMRGSKQALQVVSSFISVGDWKSLEGLVSTDIMPVLKHNIAKMTLKQRLQLEVQKGDVYIQFPYQIGIIIEDAGLLQKRLVEITMVFHAMRGLADMLQRGEAVRIDKDMPVEQRKRLTICNYRFRKEFTKGVKDDWTINLLNHFLPDDYLN